FDLCSYAPGRLLGVSLLYPYPDPAATREQCRLAAEHGFKAVYIPPQAGVDLPALYDPYWDPMWAAIDEFGLAAHIHAGFGLKQGVFDEIVNIAQTAARDIAGADVDG